MLWLLLRLRWCHHVVVIITIAVVVAIIVVGIAVGIGRRGGWRCGRWIQMRLLLQVRHL